MSDRNQEDLVFEGKSIDFKPINPGLGFHHEPVIRHPARKRQATKSIAPSRAGDITRRLLEETTVKETQAVVLTETVIASYTLRFIAWTVDLILISALVVLTMLVFQRFSGVSIGRVIDTLGREQSFYAIGSIFVAYYLFYFSVLDYSFTPGKYLSKIRLTGKITVQKTFMRAFVTLTSVMLLFVPLLLKWEDKVSETSINKL